MRPGWRPDDLADTPAGRGPGLAASPVESVTGTQFDRLVVPELEALLELRKRPGR